MALIAGHVGMPARQGQMCLGVVVKYGGYPALCIVAVAAVCFSVLGQKLFVMSIVVAGFTLLRCPLEP